MNEAPPRRRRTKPGELHGCRTHGDNCIAIIEKLTVYRSLTPPQLEAMTRIPLKAVLAALRLAEERHCLVRRHGEGMLCKSYYSLRHHMTP